MDMPGQTFDYFALTKLSLGPIASELEISNLSLALETDLKLFSSVRGASIAVGMVLEGQLAVGVLDLLLRRRRFYAQDFVVVLRGGRGKHWRNWCHRGSKSTLH